MSIDAFDLGRVDPPSPETRNRAALLAADWALDKEDPEEELRMLLEALGMRALPESQRCYRCKKDRQAADYKNRLGSGRLLTCSRCRTLGGTR